MDSAEFLACGLTVYLAECTHGAYSYNGEIKNIKSISILNTLQQCTPIHPVSFRIQILMLKHTTPSSNYGLHNPINRIHMKDNVAKLDFFLF